MAGRSGGGSNSRRQGPRSPMPAPTPGGTRTSPRQFVGESWAELRKVQWPTARHTLTGTLVVGVFTAFFAIYLTAVDAIARPLVDILLGRG